MPMTPKEMVRLLKKNGFVEIRQKGSHLMKLENRLLYQCIEKICQKGLSARF